jgi:hypothetical protein
MSRLLIHRGNPDENVPPSDGGEIADFNIGETFPEFLARNFEYFSRVAVGSGDEEPAEQ